MVVSAITWFRGRRFPTTIWSVRMRHHRRTRYCAPSANSRLRQPDTFWTRHAWVDTTNRNLRIGRGLRLTSGPQALLNELKAKLNALANAFLKTTKG